MTSMSLILLPRISEKALSNTSQKEYVFYVPLKSNKDEIKRAIEAQYSVQVKSVRTVVTKGKVKNSARRRLQPLAGRRADKKKAYVALSSGEIKVLEDNVDAG
jgi:large subunit ribosomal protein L23